jgi:O-antigen ligase
MIQGIPANTWLGMSAQDPKKLGVSVIEYADERWLRAYGTLPHPNMLGGMLSVASLLALAMYAQTYVSMVPWYGKWESMPAEEKTSFRNWDLGSFIAFLLTFIGLLLTFSRSAWLGFAVGSVLILFLGIALFRGNVRRAIVLAIGKLGSVALLIFMFFNAVFGPLWIARTNDQSRLADVSVSERAQLMTDAHEIIAQHPLKGVGLGGYLPVLMAQEPGQQVYRYQPVHNAWLLLWSELGLAGIMLFAAWLAGLIMSMKGLARCVLAGGLPATESLIIVPLLGALGVMFYFDHFWFSLPFGLLLSAFSIGLILKNASASQVDGGE